MIIESIVASLTVIFVSSLVFANHTIKKQREWDLEDSKPESEPEPEPVIYPFLEGRIDVPCPKCKRPTKNAVYKQYDDAGVPLKQVVEEAEGLSLPVACSATGPQECKAYRRAHMHVSCFTCKAKWFMATADSTQETTKQDTDHQ